MGFQSKTYSLSDEVVAAIEAARAEGLTPNKYLRYLIGLDGKGGEKIAEAGFVGARRGDVDIHLSRRGPRPKGDKTR